MGTQDKRSDPVSQHTGQRRGRIIKKDCAGLERRGTETSISIPAGGSWTKACGDTQDGSLRTANSERYRQPSFAALSICRLHVYSFPARPPRRQIAHSRSSSSLVDRHVNFGCAETVRANRETGGATLDTLNVCIASEVIKQPLACLRPGTAHLIRPLPLLRWWGGTGRGKPPACAEICPDPPNLLCAQRKTRGRGKKRRQNAQQATSSAIHQTAVELGSKARTARSPPAHQTSSVAFTGATFGLFTPRLFLPETHHFRLMHAEAMRHQSRTGKSCSRRPSP